MSALIKSFSTKLIPAIIAIAVATQLAGCKHIEDDRTPPAGVWIVFATEPVWTTYGVTAALDYRYFILSEGIPENFPYTKMMQTGYGGVLLVGDINGRPAAYDMSCPVENKPDIRIQVDKKTNQAVCPKCGSRYEIVTNYGFPISGPAAESKFGLRKYNISPGPTGEYRVIRP